MDIYLEANNLSFAYGRGNVLKEIDLKLKRGSRLALLGVNGAGKSTFINLALGLLRPKEGSITLMGGDPCTKKNRQEIGYLPQSLQFPGTLKVKEILSYIGAHYSSDHSKSLISDLGLEKLANKKLKRLSGGENRLVSLAAALISKPRLLILDEPTNAMDFTTREIVYQYLAEMETTLLFTTHNIEEIEKLAEDVVLLYQGEIFKQGTVEEIKKEFGLSSITFESSHPETHYEFANKSRYHNGITQLWSCESDSLLKEIYEKEPGFKNLTLSRPSFDEVFRSLSEKQ